MAETRERRQTGFSLIELLVGVAVIAMLAGLLYPRYREQVARARLAEGRMALMSLADRLEQCRARRGSYEDCTGMAQDSAPGGYRIEVEVSATTFRLQGRDMEGRVPEACRRLEVDQRGWLMPQECW